MLHAVLVDVDVMWLLEDRAGYSVCDLGSWLEIQLGKVNLTVCSVSKRKRERKVNVGPTACYSTIRKCLR